jgi:two-component system, chemotaxis family, CheB/CheR fusion protein
VHKTAVVRLVWFEVVPISVGNLKELYFMVVFHDETSPMKRTTEARRTRLERESEASSARIAKLEQELSATKEYLQSVIETQEATNEELQSANEEILSSNEELQSTNEELETAKEELQSANEELTTVNDELRNRNLEISQVNNDLTNLLGSIDIAVVMVGSDLTIRRFTPEAQKYLGLIPTDVGRPLLNINPTIEIPDFQGLVLQVMASLRPVEKELKDGKGSRLLMRILPYRTTENKIDGAVLTIMGINAGN